MKKQFTGRCMLAIFLLVAAASCTKNTTQENYPATTKGELSKIAKAQMDSLFNNFSAAGQLAQFPLQPVRVAYAGSITDNNRREQVLDQLTSETAYTGGYDGKNVSSLKVTTYGSTAEGSRIRAGLRSYLEPLIKTGQGLASITWRYNNKEFNSLFVFDENGFVYENMIANIAIVQETPPADRALYWKNNYPANFDILWVWGGQRGHVTCQHSAQCNNSLLNSHYGTPSAWMSLGSAKADIFANGSTASKSCTTWGWAWATPTITISVTTNWSASGTYNGVSWSGKIDASAGGSIGSSGSSSGFSVIGCP